MAAVQKRNTIQRKLVSDAVFDLKNHPTADDIYQSIAQTHKSISRGTVYRNLNYLVEDGFIRRVPVFDGADRFDHTLSSHSHMKCTVCGGVFDLPPEDDEMAQKLLDCERLLTENSDFDISGYEIIFKGLCPACQ